MENCHVFSTILEIGVHILELHAQNSPAALPQFVCGIIRDNLPEALREMTPDFTSAFKLCVPGGRIQDLKLYCRRNMDFIMPQSEE